MNNKRLKIGLYIEDYNVENWFYSLVEEIQKSDCLEIVLTINKPPIKSKTTLELLNKSWKYINQILFKLYSSIEKKIIKNSIKAFETKSLKSILNCEEILLLINNQQSFIPFKKEQLKQIKLKQLDVIICQEYNELICELINLTKNGVWYYKHGTYNINSNKHSGIWETLKKDYDTRVSLNVLKESFKNEMVIYETYFNTDHVYIWRNRCNVFWKSKSIMKRKLKELHKLGSGSFFTKVSFQFKDLKKDNKIYEVPNNFETLRYITKLYLLAFKKVIKRQFYFDQWILLFSLNQNDKKDRDFKKFTRLLPPKDRFWADPFIITKNSKNFIFFEELIYIENRGKISVIEMDNNGNHTKPEVVLENDYHLSYPFIVEDNGELYMIPETEENRTIELYKCIKFPSQWKLEKVLFNNLKAVDSTIIKHNGKYWLFTNLCEYKGEDVINELFLFYSDNLVSDTWTSHPKNPITTDHKYSRPAGSIFVHDNKLFRPAQNCSKHYGYGILIQEIIKMDENDYEEKNIDSIYPDWERDLISTHTINTSGSLSFIDAKINRKK